MNKIKLALIGVGYFGKFHLLNIFNTPFNLIGMYDADVNKSYEIAKKYKIQNYTNVEQLINDCDALVVAAPTINHYQFITNSISSGKHVFVEKPMCANLLEAEQIKNLSKKSKTILQVGHIERFNPVFSELKLEKSEIIHLEMNRFATYNPRGTDVSVIFDLMIHDIDLVLNLMGNQINEIIANGQSKLNTKFEFASATFRFDNGSCATLNSSIIHPYPQRLMKIWTKEQYIELDLMGKSKKIYKYANSPDTNFNIFAEIEEKNYPSSNPILDELNSFYNSIISGTKPKVTVQDGYGAIKLAEIISNKIKMQ
jgi:predicted dehydrogenase